MSNIAIKVEGLGKEYIIGHKKESDLRNAFGQQLNRLLQGGQTTKESFWALQDINFEIKQGEAVGIIGRNGAGKSTLLKILSRITEPTTGRFEINGRVSSLLEVGTGFHMELTGRENIYLNGTILGMKRAEIKAKFDEIVAFSGVEKFIDTPVKHYSSGMKVRLAFSVAAHLEPEILIVDEVLAVGDAEFQKKCLGKMDDVSKNEGRTVLFVSHNMGAVQNLCTRGIYLKNACLFNEGSANEVIRSYLNETIYTEHLADFGLYDDEDFKLLSIRATQNGSRTKIFQNSLPILVELKYLLKNNIKGLRIRIDVIDEEENLIFRSHIDDYISGFITKDLIPDYYTTRVTFPENLFVVGNFFLNVFFSLYGIRSLIGENPIRIPLSIEETGTLSRLKYPSNERGKLTIPIKWQQFIEPNGN